MPETAPSTSLCPTTSTAALRDDQKLTIDLRAVEPDSPSLDERLTPYRMAQRLTTAADILRARRLHAAVFVNKGFISPEDLAPDGSIGEGKDPWRDTSSYFGVSRDGAVVATARQISLPDHRRLPALTLAGLAKDALAPVLALPPARVVEISALARDPGGRSSDVAAVYVRMWEESLALGHRAWVMAVDVPVFTYLSRFFAGDAIQPLGPEQHYLGSAVLPAVIWFQDVPTAIRRLAQDSRHRRDIRPLLPQLFPDPQWAAPPLISLTA